MDKLREILCKLENEATEALRKAEQTDCPEDWDTWKEADGISIGYRIALSDFKDLLKERK